MSPIPPSFDHMLAAWNESDPAQVRRHLDRALSPEVHFVDPSVDIVGIDAFEANVHHVHEQIPDAVYSRTSEVDEHHGHYRYHWAIHLNDELLLAGFDVSIIDQAGRVEKVIGFFGPLEPSH
ncbi:MAG: nuclear transport factor 2 family protein [Actinomycetota bacterium]